MLLAEHSGDAACHEGDSKVGSEDYEPGHADYEVRRQQLQAKLMQPMTEWLLHDLGLREGQTVLDIGCGPGDVSLLAAEKVGRGGHVIGIDLASKAVVAAQRRAQAAGLDNVEFHVGSESELDAFPKVDLIIGRLVLIHQPDPVKFLRTLVAKARPGGMIAFHEHAGMTPPRSRPPLPMFDEAVMTITNCFQSAFQSPYAALEMSDLFRRAGLPPAKMIARYPVFTDADSHVFEWCCLCLRLFSDIGMLRHYPHDLTCLSDRLRSEFRTAGAQAFGMLELCGWAQV